VRGDLFRLRSDKNVTGHEVDGVRTRVLVDQMRAVDASRLGDFAGRLSGEETAELDRAVRLMLGVL